MKFGFVRTVVLAALVPSLTAALFSHRASPSVYPVSKVVDLLRNMKAELEKEGDADEEIYEKFACWCETSDKARSKAIADAEAHLSDLEAAIEKNAAMSATLKVEIEGLEKEIARNQDSLATATALRAKQKADFVAEEKEMVQSIQALGAAVTVLAKHHTGGASFISSEDSVSALATIRTQLKRHEDLLRGVITPRQRRTLSALVQVGGSDPADYSGHAPTFRQKYTPQSGEIFGILRQMKTTFETDLSQSQREELEAQQAYTDLKVAKEEEIKAGQVSLEDKTEQLAKADEAEAQAKVDREDTQASLSADQKFLVEMKQKCSMTDQEWEERQKLRAGELAAVAQAIAILSSDDARDLFSKTFNRGRAAFVQIARVEQSEGRRRAAELLAEVALRTGSPKLSVLATSVQLDSFERVKRAIDDMVDQLMQGQAAEVGHRDLCIAELSNNERSTARELHTKKDLESQIATLEMNIRGLNTTINVLKAEIDELGTARERAEQDRQVEKQDFDSILAEQQQAEGLLRQALSVLRSQFAAEEAGLIQQQVQDSQDPSESPPPGFTTYEKSGQSPSALALIEHIAQNCQLMQQELTKAEEAAKEAHLAFLEDSQKSVEAKETSVTNKESAMTTAEEDLLQAKSELAGTVTGLETLSNGLADLKSSCDYTIKNFEVRQDARSQEIEALRQAKAFLSGMQ